MIVISKKTLMVAALLTSTCAGLTSNARASEECRQIDGIIESGLDRQHPFARVAGLTLPEADSCDVEYGDLNDEWNVFECRWNAQNHLILERLQDEEDVLFDQYINHDGGSDAWDEADELIEKANYWARTYNAGVEEFPRPNAAQRAKLLEWRDRAKRLARRAHAAEEKAMELDREQEEAEAIYEAKENEVEKYERELEQKIDQQAGNLYMGIFECFSGGLIRNRTAYEVDPDDMSWTSEGGCVIDVESYEGPRLSIACPNPKYQGQ